MTQLPKAVLVTGAARRIGRAIALDLASEGWAVAVHYYGSPDDAEQTVEEIRSRDGQAVAVRADLREAEETLSLVKNAANALGTPLTALINNASIFEDDRLQTFNADSWQNHMNVNLMAPALLSQQFAAQLSSTSPGNIINMIDQRVLKLNPQYFSYTTSKAGLLTLTKTMAQALAPTIRVNAVGPGPTLANSRQSVNDFATEAANVPLGIGPTLDEICRTIRFLLETPSITGQMMTLDGGQHLAWRTADILED